MSEKSEGTYKKIYQVSSSDDIVNVNSSNNDENSCSKRNELITISANNFQEVNVINPPSSLNNSNIDSVYINEISNSSNVQTNFSNTTNNFSGTEPNSCNYNNYNFINNQKKYKKCKYLILILLFILIIFALLLIIIFPL